MYKIVDKENFDVAWSKLLSDHNVEDNNWLSSTYELKEKWVACFRKKFFTLGIQSTLLSESFNSNLKDLMNPNLDLVQFFMHLERMVDEKR